MLFLNLSYNHLKSVQIWSLWNNSPYLDWIEQNKDQKTLCICTLFMQCIIWDKVFKNGPSKFLKNITWPFLHTWILCPIWFVRLKIYYFIFFLEKSIDLRGLQLGDVFRFLYIIYDKSFYGNTEQLSAADNLRKKLVHTFMTRPRVRFCNKSPLNVLNLFYIYNSIYETLIRYDK